MGHRTEHGDHGPSKCLRTFNKSAAARGQSDPPRRLAHSRGRVYLVRMDECCAPPPLNLGGSKKQADAYRRVLWAVLAINAAMFAVEVIAGLAAGSAALQADALDFLGDAANYAISLFVVGMALRYRASGLARLAWNAAERFHNGHRRPRGAASQRCDVRAPLGLSSW